MTDSLPNTLSTPGDNYSVFEQDQVLDSNQLNSLASYLNYQEHLTRVKLLGVGIVGGLRVSRRESTVSVSKGVGVTTDGDVLTMPADTVFQNFRLYGPESPRYAPLYEGEAMRKVFELVRDDLVDETCEKLSDLPVNLGEMVVLYMMERYEDDPDVCSGTDCDNLGKTAFDRPRVLLISRGDASALMKMSEAIGQVVSKLPAMAAARPTISQGIATTSALAEIYRQ